MLKVKIERAWTKVLNESQGLVRAVMSTEQKDRDGDIIRQEYWDLDDFLKHPVLISGHDYRDVRSQIGEWKDVSVKQRPMRLEGTAQYYIGKGNDQADWAFELAKLGRAAYSVGFIPDMTKAISLDGEDSIMPSFEFRGQKLLETSHVTIPANAGALQLAKFAHPNMDPAVMELINEALESQGADISTGGLDALTDDIVRRVLEKLEDPLAWVITPSTWTHTATTNSTDWASLSPGGYEGEDGEDEDEFDDEPAKEGLAQWLR